MEVAAIVVSIISALIAGISATIAWLALRPRPALHADLLFSRPLGVSSKDPEYNFVELLLCSIYNRTTMPTQIIGVGVEADIGKGFKTWLHAGEMLASIPELNWSQGGYTYYATFSDESLIFWPPQPLNAGIARFGILPVFGYVPEGILPRAYRITLIDGSGRNHIFAFPAEAPRKRKSNRGIDVRFLFQMAGAKVTREPTEQATTHEQQET